MDTHWLVYGKMGESMKKNSIVRGLFLGAFFCFWSVERAQESPTVAEQVIEKTHGMLIMLDEKETWWYGKEINGIRGDFAAAVWQEAGPILVSASILADFCKAPLPQKNAADLLVRLEEIRGVLLSDKVLNAEESFKLTREGMHITLSPVAFNTETAHKWVIKKVNRLLYLLLPVTFLDERKIKREDVEEYRSELSLTEVEKILGLKVNHMRTVSPAVIKKPYHAPEFADYFVDSLSDVFITKNEYYKSGYRALIPSWALFITGHGLIRYAVAHLSIEQFKKFLLFLDEKINTRLLYYSTCYAAGSTAELLYKDAENAVGKSYPFPIITQALTDAPTYGQPAEIYAQDNSLKLRSGFKFADFLGKATIQGPLDFRGLVSCITPPVDSAFLSGCVPQIKFPGVAWFSAIDQEKVVSIGSVLAKTHNGPLDIATFFRKKGVNASPLAVLLYARDIPFELIINTDPLNDPTVKSPVFVSMVPGTVLHRIKKMSSELHSINSILAGFVALNMANRKTFFIDEVSAPTNLAYITGSNKPGAWIDEEIRTISQVMVVSDNGKDTNVYFTYEGEVYVKSGFALAKKATEEERKRYDQLLVAFAGKDSAGGNDTREVLVSTIQMKAKKKFAKSVSLSDALEAIKEILGTMPFQSTVRIQKITLLPDDGDADCKWSFFQKISAISLPHQHKSILIGKVSTDWGTFLYDGLILTDNRIDTSGLATRVFYKGIDKSSVGRLFVPDVFHGVCELGICSALEPIQDHALDETIDSRLISQHLNVGSVTALEETIARKQLPVNKENVSSFSLTDERLDHIIEDEVAHALSRSAMQEDQVQSENKKNKKGWKASWLTGDREQHKTSLSRPLSEKVSDEQVLLVQKVKKLLVDEEMQANEQRSGTFWTLDIDTIEPVDPLVRELANVIRTRIKQEKQDEVEKVLRLQKLRENAQKGMSEYYN